jgi:hypothetical protein
MTFRKRAGNNDVLKLEVGPTLERRFADRVFYNFTVEPLEALDYDGR